VNRRHRRNQGIAVIAGIACDRRDRKNKSQARVQEVYFLVLLRFLVSSVLQGFGLNFFFFAPFTCFAVKGFG
jgi:hypothetical protein